MINLKLFNDYHNPFYHWWKVRKYFKRPKCHIYCGKQTWFFGLPIRDDQYNKIMDIRCKALGWKDKYDSPRHEWDPFIAFTFFKKYQLIFIFNWIDLKDPDSTTRSMATWEAILDMLYYNKTIEYCINNNVWINKKDDSIITIIKNIHKKYN